MTVTTVVQFGLATMPWCPRTAWALISGTTSGTAGSIRNAFDLSTTTAPARTARGACSFDWAVPAEKKAISTPRKASGVTFSTRMESPAKVTDLPTERSDANARSSRTGNFRSSRIRSVISPAAPVAPTTATRCPAMPSSEARLRAGPPPSASAVERFQLPNHPVCHRGRPDQRGAGCVNVLGAMPRGQGPLDSLLHAVGIRGPVQRVAEQHRGRQDGRQRVRDPLSRDVRGGAMNRLVQPHRAVAPLLAEA